jgi:hypothetical protein
MEAIRKTFVSFQFSPAFIIENEDEESNLVLESGITYRVAEKYEEVEVQNRFLSTLKVPKGTLRFYFYDRLVGTAYADGEVTKMYSDPIEKSVSEYYYLENEGCLLTPEKIKNGEGFHPLHPERRDYLLQLMDEHNCDRLLQTGYEDGDFLLESNDKLIDPDQVQMVDTEIPWPNT